MKLKSILILYLSGLDVIGTVSDQVITNETTIHQLMQRHFVRTSGCLLKYKVLGKDIIHCYDVPHLLKVERNNLQVKDLHHHIQKRWSISDSSTGDSSDSSNKSSTSDKAKPKVASWADVSRLYEQDRCGMPRSLKKVNAEHINPVKLKMKVCVAAQVFSLTYGTVMQQCVEKMQMPAEASGTAQILIFFNDLFDSLNGSATSQPGSLKGSINEHSVINEFYRSQNG